MIAHVRQLHAHAKGTENNARSKAQRTMRTPRHREQSALQGTENNARSKARALENNVRSKAQIIIRTSEFARRAEACLKNQPHQLRVEENNNGKSMPE
jgi:hypothetical protein